MNWKKFFGYNYEWHEPKRQPRYIALDVLSSLLGLFAFLFLAFNIIKIPVGLKIIFLCTVCTVSEIVLLLHTILINISFVFIVFLGMLLLSNVVNNMARSMKLNDRIESLEAALAVMHKKRR